MASIIVNGEEKTVEESQLSYEDVVVLASKNPSNPYYTVIYRWGMGNMTVSGILSKWETVDIANGMVFDVAMTNNT